jgi:hypothetical protein
VALNDDPENPRSLTEEEAVFSSAYQLDSMESLEDEYTVPITPRENKKRRDSDPKPKPYAADTQSGA